MIPSRQAELPSRPTKSPSRAVEFDGAETKAAAHVCVRPKCTGPAFVRGPVQRPKPDPTLHLLRPNHHENPNLMCRHYRRHNPFSFRRRSCGVLLLRFQRFVFFDATIPTSTLTSTWLFLQNSNTIDFENSPNKKITQRTNPHVFPANTLDFPYSQTP